MNFSFIKRPSTRQSPSPSPSLLTLLGNWPILNATLLLHLQWTSFPLHLDYSQGTTFYNSLKEPILFQTVYHFFSIPQTICIGMLFKGFEFGSHPTEVSLLQYVDDTILMLDANSGGLGNAKKVRYCFERVLGL